MNKSPMKIFICLLTSILTISGAMMTYAQNNDQDFTKERLEMVQNQIVRRGVDDERVLEAMRTVKRHFFVPDDVRKHAYSDNPLAIGYRQTISQPYIVALMTELLELDGSEKVLEIGSGSGYQAAVLGKLANEVYTIEIVPELAQKAKETLDQLGYDNVHVRHGDGFHGWAEHAPYDAIIVTAAPDEVPQPLIDQLQPDGRLVIPEGSYYQQLRVYIKRDGYLEKKDIIPVRFVPMTGYIEEK